MDTLRILELAGILNEAKTVTAKFKPIKNSQFGAEQIQLNDNAFCFSNNKNLAFILDPEDSPTNLKELANSIIPIVGSVVVDQKLWDMLVKEGYLNPVDEDGAEAYAKAEAEAEGAADSITVKKYIRKS